MPSLVTTGKIKKVIQTNGLLVPKIYCVANQKGGVGKTTTAINLAAALALHNQKVLLIDLDPQGNATMGSGIDKANLQKNIYDVLIGKTTLHEAIVQSDVGQYDVLPSNRELSGAEIDLVGMQNREKRLGIAISESPNQYDYVLIDCPPALSLLTLNGFSAANGVIIPMQCEYFALEGLSDLVNTIKRVHRNLNPKLNLIGLLRVMFDARVTLQQQVSDQLEAHFNDKVFTTIIPRNVRLAEAPSHGVSGVSYDRNSRGAKAYISFAKELMDRVDMTNSSKQVV